MLKVLTDGMTSDFFLVEIHSQVIGTSMKLHSIYMVFNRTIASCRKYKYNSIKGAFFADRQSRENCIEVEDMANLFHKKKMHHVP